MGFVNKLIYDLEEKIHMYKYFISFTYSSYEKGGYGNVIIEADHKISDLITQMICKSGSLIYKDGLRVMPILKM